MKGYMQQTEKNCGLQNIGSGDKSVQFAAWYEFPHSCNI